MLYLISAIRSFFQSLLNEKFKLKCELKKILNVRLELLSIDDLTKNVKEK